jgi:hypothetical protein
MERRKSKRRQKILGIKPESPLSTRFLEEPQKVNVNPLSKPASEERRRNHVTTRSFQNKCISAEDDATFERISSINDEYANHDDKTSNGAAKQTRLEPVERGLTKTIDQDEAVVDVELIFCHHCQKSYAPATYKKFCQAVDENGVPKCVSMRNKKRKVYNSAKVRQKIPNTPRILLCFARFVNLIHSAFP